MPKAQFHHTTYAPGQPRTNNTIGGLFLHDPWLHLVGEAGQNSRDGAVRLGESTALLTLRFSSILRSRIAPYGLGDVDRHVGACTEHDISASPASDAVRILFFEDRSCGLEGISSDIRGDTLSPAQRYLYVVGSGNEGKSGSDNGRHGLGSSVGPFASKSRCMYFHTTRSDGTSFASARLSLPTRKLDGEYYGPESRLGVVEDGVWKGPLEGSDADDLARAFKFDRPVDQTGLSCAIIDPVDGMTAETLAAAALANQFYQIANGEISIRIIDEDSGFDVTLDASTIDDVIASSKMADFIAAGGRKRDYRILADLAGVLAFIRSYPGTDTLNEVQEAAITSAAADLRPTWLSNQPCGLRIPMSVNHSARGTVTGAIGVWIQSCNHLSSGYDILVRNSIVIVSPTTGRISLNVSKGDGFSVFLGDCEDPSHRAFREQLGKQRGWPNPRGALSSFKNAARNVHTAIIQNAKEMDRLSLAKFFPTPGQDITSTIPGGPQDDNGEPGIVVMDSTSSFGLVEKIDRKSGAVVISLSKTAIEASEAGLSFDFSITAEYEGSSRGKGSFVDSGAFFAVEGGAAEHSISGNTLQVYGTSEELRIRISNLDQNRDLKISYAEITATQALEDAA